MEQPNPHFIQDVISFIDAPLSPSTLNKLKKSCRGQGLDAAASAAVASTGGGVAPVEVAEGGSSPKLGETPVYSSMSYLYPVGSEVEAQHLHNTTEFNGMRGTVVGHQDGKILVEFYGYAGQVFDIPTFNVRLVTPGAPSVVQPTTTLAPPAPILPVNPAFPVYTPPALSSHTANLLEANGLKDKLRMSLTHVEVSKDAMTHAAALDVLSHDELVSVVGELQPTLSRQNISKNWRKIVQIYMAHAEKVASTMAARDMSTHALATTPQEVMGGAMVPGVTPGATVDLAGNLESVINFIDKPLSPRTLKEMKHIRHSCSPRRGRSSSP